MNPLKFLMGGGKVAEKVLDIAVKGGDKMVLTSEEERDYKHKAHELFLRQLEAEAGSQGASSVTRRVLAFMLVGPYSLCILLAMLFWGIEEPAKAQGYLNILQETWIPVSMALTYYFGRQWQEKKDSK